MNRHVNAISGRLSLRTPQRRSLEILHRITEIAPPGNGNDLAEMIKAIQSEFPTVTDFERDFPSLCFALATGVGKTRLMGAFISYLYLEHGIRNFFVMAPNLTIYNKLITDFSPNTEKYVFKGIAEFAVNPPTVITGDTYESGIGIRTDHRKQHHFAWDTDTGVHINIFNISKINAEVRGGHAPRIKRLSEYIGESYFEYLSGLPDLVLLMDESHRYRASAGVRAINELKPVLGLELTATPFVESGRGAVQFKNVIYDYPLGKAMVDGYVKEPAVVTRKDFNPAGMSPDEIERIKLEDGIRLHESVKVELETYARENNRDIVKPFLLVIARDTTHASRLLKLIQSNSFFDGRYAEKVIQVDSSQTGKKEEEMIERLLKVEDAEEPTEIVIHVNMLKEGWDVTNLYTIVPLRAANARILIEQSIGRGLRLPYKGKRTGVISVDRLNIVAHDKFEEIIAEANRPDSSIRMQAVILDNSDLIRKTATVVSRPTISDKLGITPGQVTDNTRFPGRKESPVFTKPDEQEIAQAAWDVIRNLSHQPDILPGVSYLNKPDVQKTIINELKERYPAPRQMTLDGSTEKADIEDVVAKTIEVVTRQTIDIPRILVLPKGELKTGFKRFSLELSTLHYQSVPEELWIQHLRTHTTEILSLGQGGIEESRLEDVIVSGLMDFNDISYDDHADHLYDLASQTVKHFKTYLSEEEVRKVLRCYQKNICQFIHAQMQAHYWEDAVEYEVKISKGFTELKESAYSYSADEPPLDVHASPDDKSNMSRYLFGGFQRCLYPVQKFDSEAERKLALILERDALKWFKPAKGQFQMFYRHESDHLEYIPDFVAETDNDIFILEPKAANQMNDPAVLAKQKVAVTWCNNASAHTKSYAGKPWRYILIPHTEIASNITLGGLVERFAVS
ncbi:DEAD/DEAH box helicase family protein [Desulfatiferula olefinivorans]